MLRTFRAALTALALAALPGGYALAADAPAKPAGDFPAATPPVKKMEVPKGFEKVVGTRHTVLAEPNDVKWVTEAIKDVPLPTKVAGGPADMIDSLTVKNRALLVKQITADLGVDEKAATDLIDAEIIPALNKLNTMKPPLFYLVTTPDKLRQLAKDGWGAPRYYYNRVADSAVFDDNISFSVEKESDDIVLPSFVDPKSADAVKGKNLATMLQNMDQNVLASAANQVNNTVFAKLVEFIEKQFKPLNLKDDQSWLGKGAATYLSAKYMGIVTGQLKDRFLSDLVAEDRAFPVSARSVNLLSPPAEAVIQEALRPYYAIAKQRKATLAVYQWVNAGGSENVIPDTLKAIRGKMPADGKALVKQIEETTKVDVTKFLVSQ